MTLIAERRKQTTSF